jgi:hypothetical protein
MKKIGTSTIAHETDTIQAERRNGFTAKMSLQSPPLGRNMNDV